MDRRSFLRLCAGGLAGAGSVLAAGAACADSYQTAVMSQLRKQGYREINVERTLLGRVRIVAARRGASREIILNPRTGEILRDVVLAADGSVEPQISGDDNSGKGSSVDDNGSDENDSEDNDSEDHDADGNGDSENNGSGGSGKED